MTEKTVRDHILIQASAEKLWKVLTEAAYTRQYMFGCEATTDWRLGSELLWNGRADDKVVTYVKGRIVGLEPGKKLAYTTFDPNGGMRDEASNYVTVVCTLVPQGTGIRLEVSQGDFQGLENEDKRFEDTKAGWASVLPRIKEIAESL